MATADSSNSIPMQLQLHRPARVADDLPGQGGAAAVHLPTVCNSYDQDTNQLFPTTEIDHDRKKSLVSGRCNFLVTCERNFQSLSGTSS